MIGRRGLKPRIDIATFNEGKSVSSGSGGGVAQLSVTTWGRRGS